MKYALTSYSQGMPVSQNPPEHVILRCNWLNNTDPAQTPRTAFLHTTPARMSRATTPPVSPPATSALPRSSRPSSGSTTSTCTTSPSPRALRTLTPPRHTLLTSRYVWARFGSSSSKSSSQERRLVESTSVWLKFGTDMGAATELRRRQGHRRPVDVLRVPDRPVRQNRRDW